MQRDRRSDAAGDGHERGGGAADPSGIDRRYRKKLRRSIFERVTVRKGVDPVMVPRFRLHAPPLAAVMGLVAALVASSVLSAQGPTPATIPLEELAARFGSRAQVQQASLSPDGRRVAWITPHRGQGAALLTMSLEEPGRPRAALRVDGTPDRLDSCEWLSDRRLACTISAMVARGALLVPFSRVIAVDFDGTGTQVLSKRESDYARGINQYGGDVIDWLPDRQDSVLMARNYLPDDRTGTRLGSRREGLGVDRLDTRDLRVVNVEPPRGDAIGYISDGRGKVRIMAMMDETPTGYDSGVTRYLYRRTGSETWQTLSRVDVDGEGFRPVAVDPALDAAYGFKKVDGRDALYRKRLDGSGEETLVFAHPEVDVDHVVRVGRGGRVVGASYATDIRAYRYFDPAISGALASVGRALPGRKLLRIIDSSLDESRLLVWAGNDDDAGRYYLFDRRKNDLRLLMASRPDIDGRPLARMKPMTYPAADGTQVPGYITLPPGTDSIAGLPALVLPHGGPSARDEWGFDWLSQFFAARGYAVLQPNFRGSAGYGDAWLQQNGFKSWRTAIGDVIDAGRWLLREGADPARLGIFGWSYGGYAALQSAVVEPDLFKAVVAVAPVTDLAALAEERRDFSSYRLTRDFIGTGPHLEEGSPAKHAARIRAPVLLFHGDLDRNVRSRQSKVMERNLEKAGRSVELITWEQLDHYLEDSEARTRLLAESDRFIQQAFRGVE